MPLPQDKIFWSAAFPIQAADRTTIMKYMEKCCTWFLSAPTVYSAPVTRYSGPFFGSAFSSVAVTNLTVGNVTINFTSATSAMLTYTIDGVAVTRYITSWIF